MLIRLFCAVLATLAAAAPAAAGKEQWDFVKSGSEVLLVYGVPESEDVTLSFICEPKRKTIQIVTTVLPRNTKQGRSGATRLSNGASNLEYAGKTGRDNADAGVHFAASTSIDARLFDLLEKGTSVRVEAFGARENVPLARIAVPLKRMREACR